MKKNAIIITILVAIIAAGAGFFGGMQYQKMQPRSANFAQFAGGLGGRGGNTRFGQNGANRPVVGEIISSDANSITVKMMDGSTKIVVVGGSTSINKAATGTIADLKTGETVAVFGTQNQDGSVTAQNVQINPQMRFGRPSESPMPTK
jgi:hypothetical protein